MFINWFFSGLCIYGFVALIHAEEWNWNSEDMKNVSCDNKICTFFKFLTLDLINLLKHVQKMKNNSNKTINPSIPTSEKVLIPLENLSLKSNFYFKSQE